MILQSSWLFKTLKKNFHSSLVFDLFGYTRVGSREQTVNLLATSPSLVRVQLSEPFSTHTAIFLIAFGRKTTCVEFFAGVAHVGRAMVL